MKKPLSYLFNPYIGPIFVVSLVVIGIILFYLPAISAHNNKVQATKQGLKLIENLRDVRAYYTSSVISKITSHPEIKVNFDHLDKNDTIPLPATLLHDLSAIVPKDGMQMNMYSKYPFPNRKERELDSFEKRSLEWLEKNPQEVYTKVTQAEGEKRFRVAVADTMVADACVRCHNSRADSPKTDWKVGDVRGVIEVLIPFKNDFILSPNQTLYITFGLIGLLLLMGIHYGVLSFLRSKEYHRQQKQLQEKIEEKTASLQASNILLNQYKKAVDSSAIVSKTDKYGKITYVNDQFIRISGYSEEELIGKPHNIVRHPAVPKEVFKDLWQTIKNKQIWKGQITNRAKDGSSYHVASTIVPIVNSEAQIQEYLAIRLDVTKIIEANEKAQQADRAKSLFLANMSHEVRTPLNAIIGFSQVLSRSNELNIKDKKYASIIETSAKSLLGIINDILDISKIESGNFDISIESTDICHIGEHVVELFSARAVEKDIKLIFDIDLMPACVKTDGVRLRQVLSNLLGNAIKFTPKGGKIFIDVKNQSITQDKAVINFSIRDTGIGIPKEKLSTIFDAFTQVDNSSNREYEGTGLGLNISYNIVKSLGGELSVKSEVEKGSEFHFSLECEICDDILHENEHTVQDLKIAVTDNNSQLFGYAKRFINLFGKVGTLQEIKDPDIVLCCCAKDDTYNLEKSRESFGDRAKIFLFEEQNLVDELELKADENAIALPFYASKINDSIAELLSKSRQLPRMTQQPQFSAKILVAEDNSANQELISYMLESFGVDFVIAEDGEEAFKEYQNAAYDLVLMDINMPKVDGIEALKMIREYEQKGQKRSIPVIALTANAIKGDKERFLDAGMDDYLTKPIDSQSLNKLLKKYLDDQERAKPSVDKTEQKQQQRIALSSDFIAKKLGVSQKVAQMLIKKFQATIKKDLNELSVMIENEQMQQVKQKAHYIKNSCLNMGLESECELLQEIETKQLSKEKLQEYFATLQRLLQ